MPPLNQGEDEVKDADEPAKPLESETKETEKTTTKGSGSTVADETADRLKREAEEQRQQMVFEDLGNLTAMANHMFQPFNGKSAHEKIFGDAKENKFGTSPDGIAKMLLATAMWSKNQKDNVKKYIEEMKAADSNTVRYRLNEVYNDFLEEQKTKSMKGMDMKKSQQKTTSDRFAAAGKQYRDGFKKK